MSEDILPGLIASLSILPAAVLAVVGQGRGTAFRILCAVALAGPVVGLVVRTGPGWQTDLATALWVTVSATIICFFALCIASRDATRLGGVVLPYMSVLAFSALAWDTTDTEGTVVIISTWAVVHILVSVLTYAVVTLAACAACAGLLQERALKTRKTTAYTDHLPSVSYCTDIQFKLLALGEFILGIGLLSGIALSLTQGGPALQMDHKTLFALAAFAVIGVLLIMQPKSGMRGRQVVRVILSAYLLLTLAYPGVKFVTGVLLA